MGCNAQFEEHSSDQKVQVCYEQEGIENDSEYLGCLIDLLSDLTEA